LPVLVATGVGGVRFGAGPARRDGRVLLVLCTSVLARTRRVEWTTRCGAGAGALVLGTAPSASRGSSVSTRTAAAAAPAEQQEHERNSHDQRRSGPPPAWLRRRHGRLVAAARRRGKCRILTQDRPLELAELRARLDPELLHEHSPRFPVGLERLRLPTRPVESQDQLPAQHARNAIAN
jgi:hypothetical protein